MRPELDGKDDRQARLQRGDQHLGGNVEGHFDGSEQPVPGPERFQDGNQFFRCLHGAFRNFDAQGPPRPLGSAGCRSSSGIRLRVDRPDTA